MPWDGGLEGGGVRAAQWRASCEGPFKQPVARGCSLRAFRVVRDSQQNVERLGETGLSQLMLACGHLNELWLPSER